jgi:hypothetical protein
MTGGGRGYCALKLPESGEAPYGYAGLQGTPVRLESSAPQPTLWTRFTRWLRPGTGPMSLLGRRRGRGRGAGRGRGRRLGMW